MSFTVTKKSYGLFEKISRTLGLMSGNGGFVTLPAGTYTNTKYRALVTLENSTFTSFKVEGVEQLSARGMSGYTYPSFVYLPGGGDITDLTFTGSVIAYL